MKIGLLIAIERELKSFLNAGTDITEKTVGAFTVYHTAMFGHDIYALRSGAGIIDAAAGTQLLITAAECDIILNFGVTGALDPALRVEDLFVVRKVCAYGFDISPISPVREHQYMEFSDQYIPLDDSLISLAKSILPSLREAVVASGDRFIEKQDEKSRLHALGCNICDMEIAAIARVCFLNHISCLSIKCISDTYDGNGADFDRNVMQSAQKAFHVLTKIIQHIDA